MRSRLLIGFFAVGLVLSAALEGCGGDSESGTGGASSSGSGGATVTSTHTGTTSTGPTSTSSGMMGDGNDTFETATDMVLGTQIDAELDPTGDVDYYKFSGKKGDVVYLDIDAEDTDNVSFDPTYI